MSARVLVVEDNPTNLQLMLYLLKAFGHEVTSSTDGVSGLSAARADRFDLILCDVLMPGIDGYEFARRFKSVPGEKPPLVAVTALAMVGDKEALIAGGFDGYIAKPIDPQTFVDEIEVFLPPNLRSTRSQQAQRAAEPAAETRAGPLILAIDDVQLNLDLVKSSLEPFGYQVIEAHSAAEGIEKARAAKPALILCDLHMPDTDGFELLKMAKTSKELADVPFFFLSSTAWQTSEQIRGMQLGARKFLLRPLHPLRLRDEVALALAGHDGKNPRH